MEIHGRKDSPSRLHARRHRPAWWIGMGLSAVVHLLVLLVWPGARIPLDLFGDATAPRALHVAPVRVVSLSGPAPPRPSEAVHPERAVPRVEAAVRAAPPSRPRMDLAPIERVRGGALPTLARSGRMPPPREDRYARPAATSILTEWKSPRTLYGVGTTVRVHVDASGNATGLVELLPPTPDRGTNRELIRRVRQLKYHPALRNGEPTPAWAEIAFVFCRNGVTATSPAPPREAAGDRCPRDAPPDR